MRVPKPCRHQGLAGRVATNNGYPASGKGRSGGAGIPRLFAVRYPEGGSLGELARRPTPYRARPTDTLQSVFPVSSEQSQSWLHGGTALPRPSHSCPKLRASIINHSFAGSSLIAFSRRRIFPKSRLCGVSTIRGMWCRCASSISSSSAPVCSIRSAASIPSKRLFKA